MRFVLAVVLALLATPASAQTVENVIDLSKLGWGPITVPISVETDGDLNTREWLIGRVFSSMQRVVAEREGRICAGPWFDPSQGRGAAVVTVQRVGLVHKLFVNGPKGIVVFALDTPVCEH